MKKPAKIEELNRNLALSKEDRKIPQVGVAARLTGHIEYIRNELSGIDSSLFNVGKRLAIIQEEKDFAEDTIEEFVKNNFGRSRTWIYKMIEGYRVKEGLPENVENFLQNQGQAKALSKAPKEERAKILKEVASEGKVTAKAISEKVEEIYTVPADFTVAGKEEPLKEESEDVDEVSGEIADCDKPACADNRRLVKVLERKIRAANLEIGRLREDKEAQMKDSPYYKNAVKIFDYWKEKTGHDKSKFGLDVFKQVLPFLKEDGIDLCFMAVEGIAFQHHKDIRSNGTVKKYDSFELCFRNRAKFEEYCNRSPRHKKK